MVLRRCDVRRLAAWVLCLAPLALLGCGGRSLGVSPTGDGAPPSPDVRPIPDAQVRPDGQVVVPEVCEGLAWAAGPGQAPRGVTVTSTRIVMDCCDGATAHFHSSSFLGFDVVVMIQTWTLWPGPGTFDLAELSSASEPAMQMWIYGSPDSPAMEQQLEGFLTLEGDEPYNTPLTLSLCVTSISGDSDVDGVRLWVPRLAVIPWDWWERFALYLLDDPTIDAAEAASRPLDALALGPSPVVSLGYLAYYERSTHTLHFDPWYGGDLTRLLPEVGVYGLPFVVVVDDAPIYLGAFYTSYSSASFGQPVIVLEDVGEGTARIDRAYPGPGAATGTDPRGDPRIFELLEDAAKLAP